MAAAATTSGVNRRGEPSAGRVLVIGDSHIHALQEALETRDADQAGLRIEAKRLFKTKRRDGRPVRVTGGRFARFFRTPSADLTTLGDVSIEQALRLASRLNPQDVLVSVLGGNQHAVFSTIQHAQPFDFLLPDGASSTSPQTEAALIPYRALFPFFRTSLRDGDGETIAAFRKATKARMVHLLAPPPKRMNEWIEEHHDTLFKAEGIASQGISSPELRMKFWQLQNRAIADICTELGVEVLGVPEGASDADGFLARRFYAGDATHANIHYGELVLQQIDREFGQPAATEVVAS